MADNFSDDKQPDAPGMETPSGSGRLDRRGFLRALSGSALTVVAGGLTVTLAACQGASTSNPLLTNTGVPATLVSLTPAPSSGSGQSLGSFSLASSGVSTSSSSLLSSSSSVGLGASGTSSSSSSSTSSLSSSSSSTSSLSSSSSSSVSTLARQAMASLHPRDFVADGWNTRA